MEASSATRDARNAVYNGEHLLLKPNRAIRRLWKARRGMSEDARRELNTYEGGDDGQEGTTE